MIARNVVKVSCGVLPAKSSGLTNARSGLAYAVRENYQVRRNPPTANANRWAAFVGVAEVKAHKAALDIGIAVTKTYGGGAVGMVDIEMVRAASANGQSRHQITTGLSSGCCCPISRNNIAAIP